jgi:hypothetical protein
MYCCTMADATKIKILAAEPDADDGLIVTFSDGTTAGYVAEELLALRPYREPTYQKRIRRSEESWLAWLPCLHQRAGWSRCAVGLLNRGQPDARCSGNYSGAWLKLEIFDAGPRSGRRFRISEVWISHSGGYRWKRNGLKRGVRRAK